MVELDIWHDGIRTQVLTANWCYYSKQGLKLRKYELDNSDWSIIRDLVVVLQVRLLSLHYALIYANAIFFQQYKKATLFFSSNTASIAAVIPAIDWLHNTLNPKTKKQYHPSILVTMKLAQKKLDQYYSRTDLSSIYRIAMGKVIASDFWCLLTISLTVLHPGLKLEYFRQRE